MSHEARRRAEQSRVRWERVSKALIVGLGLVTFAAIAFQLDF